MSSRICRLIAVAACALTMLVGTPVATSAAPTDSARQPRVVTYRGDGVDIRRASGDLGKLRRTSPSFRKAVKRSLDRMWRAEGSKPRCARAAVITVKRWRSDGWARISNAGMFAPCPSGGHWEIWRAHGKRWKAVFAGQDQPTCRQLTRKHVPAGIWDWCYSDDGYAVPYRPRKPYVAVAGTYYGHTRKLSVTAAGRLNEVVYSGCCDEVSDIDYQLSDLTRSGPTWSAIATVTAVNSANPDYFDVPPAIGDQVDFTLEGDVVHLGDTTYCGPASGASGTCGA